MEQTITPYELPDVENHSFFFIDRHISPSVEAKLHRHDAWELLYVVKGHGERTAGDTLLPFAKGEVALIPPSMLHQWHYDADEVDENGCVHYVMSAFSHKFVQDCISLFPEIRNTLSLIDFPTEAIVFGHKSAALIKEKMTRMVSMSEIDRLAEMIRLLPVVFAAGDTIPAGKPIRIERDVRRMQQICAYVMAHYSHNIALDEIAGEIGMNRSAFCSYFKHLKGMTFTQFVVQYRLRTACELLKTTHRSISDICYMVGFNDLPHFTRTFVSVFGISPRKYRENISSNYNEQNEPQDKDRTTI
mgnify:CR=1 FL=1